MSRPKTVAEGWVPRQHGTTYSYQRGCRCEHCTRAHRNRNRRGGYLKAHRERNYAARVELNGVLVTIDPRATHGTHDAYNRFGCRCRACAEAKAAYVAARRARRRAS